MTDLSTLDPAVTAADYTIAALGTHASLKVLAAVRAGWLTADEARAVEPFAVALAYLLEVEVPKHRGESASVTVTPARSADVADRVSAYLAGRAS